MKYILFNSLQNIESLRHFYDAQKNYILNKAKQGMKENRMGMLTDYYFYMLANGTDDERNQQTFQNLQNKIEQHITIQEKTDKGITYIIKDKNPKPFQNISKAAIDYYKYAEMPLMHCNNTLVMLITKFEEFISDFIKFLYLKYPKRYLDSQAVTFSDIMESGIEGIRDLIVDREVDGLMRESYTKWFKLFEDHNIKLEHCKKELTTLRELYARRNIIVHNSGKVNTDYLKLVPDSNYKIGDNAVVNGPYIITAFESIKTIIFCIMIDALRLDKENKEKCSENIFNLAFDELTAENYNICEVVFSALQNSPFTDELTKQLSKVNYWISIINNRGIASVKAEIESFDASALDKSFQMAKMILLGDFEEATTLIEVMYSKKDLELYAIDEWPLFKEYRTTDYYKKFKEAHPELSDAVSSEIKPECIIEEDVMKTVKNELNDVSSN